MSKKLRKSLDDLKDEVRRMVDNVKASTKMTQEEIAVEMGYKKNYISEVLSPSGKVSAKFISKLKLRFSEVIEGQQPPRETLEKGSQNPQSQGVKGHQVPAVYIDLMKQKEATMQQLEARRNETESRLARSEAEKDRLYRIIEDNNKIIKDNMTAMLVSLNQSQSHLLDTRQLLSDVIAPQVTAHRKALETLLGDEKKSEKLSVSKSGRGLTGRKKLGDGKGNNH